MNIQIYLIFYNKYNYNIESFTSETLLTQQLNNITCFLCSQSASQHLSKLHGMHRLFLDIYIGNLIRLYVLVEFLHQIKGVQLVHCQISDETQTRVW